MVFYLKIFVIYLYLARPNNLFGLRLTQYFIDFLQIKTDCSLTNFVLVMGRLAQPTQAHSD